MSDKGIYFNKANELYDRIAAIHAEKKGVLDGECPFHLAMVVRCHINGDPMNYLAIIHMKKKDMRFDCLHLVLSLWLLVLGWTISESRLGYGIITMMLFHCCPLLYLGISH